MITLSLISQESVSQVGSSPFGPWRKLNRLQACESLLAKLRKNANREWRKKEEPIQVTTLSWYSWQWFFRLSWPVVY